MPEALLEALLYASCLGTVECNMILKPGEMFRPCGHASKCWLPRTIALWTCMSRSQKAVLHPNIRRSGLFCSTLVDAEEMMKKKR